MNRTLVVLSIIILFSCQSINDAERKLAKAIELFYEWAKKHR